MENNDRNAALAALALAAALAATASLATITSCGVNAMDKEGKSLPEPALRAGVQKISGLRLFFGHQSVGANLLSGIGEICGELGTASPNAIETKSADTASGPAVYHCGIGANGNPESKIDEFDSVLRSGMAGAVDAAFMKFCYADVDASTDVESLFARYGEAMEALERDYPELTILHFTVPLTTDEGGLKGTLKSLLGRKLRGHADNLAKERYNALLRARYSGKEPIFDIALVESTLGSGESLKGSFKGSGYPAMRPEYSDDGGHLNAAGRRHVAGHLIVALSSLVPYGE
jgi:hypothetical protein